MHQRKLQTAIKRARVVHRADSDYDCSRVAAAI